ncbi:hypothetical protein CBR_g26409 [Chara braunii]|uniref:RING-type E3 ubiquitin transferase n=1 Tax=Chara braunii TaxID=69332 RepID=A0A388L7T2_CHABU|nr:hypothetical protein CBR_g26409 [Chara braunii]|eukprot:GBG78381.1 hypothetical protein CBR_g26409 [Chara braunii]
MNGPSTRMRGDTRPPGYACGGVEMGYSVIRSSKLPLDEPFARTRACTPLSSHMRKEWVRSCLHRRVGWRLYTQVSRQLWILSMKDQYESLGIDDFVPRMAPDLQRARSAQTFDNGRSRKLGSEKVMLEKQASLDFFMYSRGDEVQDVKPRSLQLDRLRKTDKNCFLQPSLQQQQQQQQRTDRFAAPAPLSPFESPSDCRCSICKGVYTDPVILSSGYSFCRECVSNWWKKSQSQDPVCPITGQRQQGEAISNIALQKVVAYLHTVLAGAHRSSVRQVGDDSKLPSTGAGYETDEEILEQALCYAKRTDGQALDVINYGIVPLAKLAEKSKWRQVIFNESIVGLCANLLRNHRWVPVDAILQLLYALSQDENDTPSAECQDRRVTIARTALNVVLTPLWSTGQQNSTTKGGAQQLAFKVLANLLQDKSARRHIIQTGGITKELCRTVALRQLGSSRVHEKDEVSCCVFLLAGKECDSGHVCLSQFISALFQLTSVVDDVECPWVLGVIEKIVVLAIQKGEDCVMEVREAVKDAQNVEAMVSRISPDGSGDIRYASLRVLWRLCADKCCAKAVASVACTGSAAAASLVKKLFSLMKNKEAINGDLELVIQVTAAMIKNGGESVSKQIMLPRVTGIDLLVQLISDHLKGRCQLTSASCLDVMQSLERVVVDDDPGKERFLDVGGLEIILDLLRQQRDGASPSCRAVVASMLAHISSSQLCHAKVCGHGGVEILVELIKSSEEMMECRVSAVVALGNLVSDNPAAKAKLSSKNLEVGHLSAVLISPEASYHSKMAAARMFPLAGRGPLPLQDRVIPSLLELVRLDKTPDGQHSVLGAIQFLASSPRGCSRLVETAGFMEELSLLAEKSASADCREVALRILICLLKNENNCVRQAVYRSTGASALLLKVLADMKLREAGSALQLDATVSLLHVVEQDGDGRRWVSGGGGVKMLIDALYGNWGETEACIVGILGALAKEETIAVEICRQNGVSAMVDLLEQSSSVQENWKHRAMEGLYSLAKTRDDECRQSLVMTKRLVRKILHIVEKVVQETVQAGSGLPSRQVLMAVMLLQELTRKREANCIQKVLDEKGLEIMLSLLLSQEILSCRCAALSVIDNVMSSEYFLETQAGGAVRLQIAHGARMLVDIDSSKDITEGSGEFLGKQAQDDQRKYLERCKVAAANLLATAIRTGKKDYSSLDPRVIFALAGLLQVVDSGSEDRCNIVEALRCLALESECCDKLVEVPAGLKALVSLTADSEAEACREKAFQAILQLMLKGEKVVRKAVYETGGLTVMLQAVSSGSRITSSMMDASRGLLLAVEKDEIARELLNREHGIGTLMKVLGPSCLHDLGNGGEYGGCSTLSSSDSSPLCEGGGDWSEFHFRLGATVARLTDVDPEGVRKLGGEAALVAMLLKSAESSSFLLWRSRVAHGLLNLALESTSCRKALHEAGAIHALLRVVKHRASHEVAEVVGVLWELAREPECRVAILGADGLPVLLNLLESEESLVCLTATMMVVDTLTSSEEFVAWEKQRATPVGLRIAHATCMLVDRASVECRIAAAGLLSMAIVRGSNDYENLQTTAAVVLAHLVQATTGNWKAQCRVAECFRCLVSDVNCWANVFNAPFGLEALVALAMGSSNNGAPMNSYEEDCERIATHAIAKLILRVVDEPQLRRRVLEAGGVHVLLRCVEAWRGSVPQGPSETRTKAAKALLACLDTEDRTVRELVKGVGGATILVQSLKLSVSAVPPVSWSTARLDPSARWTIFDFCIGGAIAKLAVDLEDEQCAHLSEAGGIRLMVDMFLQSCLLEFIANELKIRALDGLWALARQSPLCRQQITTKEMVKRLIDIISQADGMGSFSSGSHSSPSITPGGGAAAAVQSSPASGHNLSRASPSSPNHENFEVVSEEVLRALGILREMSKDTEAGSLVIENKGVTTLLRLLDRAVDDKSGEGCVEQAIEIVHELSRKHNLARMHAVVQLGLVTAKILRTAIDTAELTRGRGAISPLVVERTLRIVRNLQLDMRTSLVKDDMVSILWPFLEERDHGTLIWDGMGDVIIAAAIRALEAYKDFPMERLKMRGTEGGMSLLIQRLIDLPMEADMASAHVCGSELLLALMSDHGGRTEAINAEVTKVTGRWLTRATEANQEQHNNNSCLSCAAIPVLRKLVQNLGLFKRDRVILLLQEAGCFKALQVLRDADYQWHDSCRIAAERLIQEWSTNRALYRFL